MDKIEKREITPNILGLSYLYLYFILTVLIFLGPEICRLEYSRISHKDRECTPLSSMFDEDRFSVSRLISVGSCKLFK